MISNAILFEGALAMNTDGWNRKWTSLAANTLMMAMGVALLLAQGRGVERWTLQESLANRAAGQIDQALEKNIVVFAGISAIKAAVALVEGSSVGVGFDIEVGDLAQPAYDYVDFVWWLFLYTILIMTFYKQLFDSGILATGLVLLGVGAMLWGLGGFLARSRPRLRLWGGGLLKAGFLIAYGVPVILILSQCLSERYTDPLKVKTAERISETRKDFEMAKQEFIGLKDRVSLMSPVESVEKVRDSLLTIVDSVAKAAWRSAGTMLYFVSILLFDLLFLPILMALMLYALFRFGMGRLERTAPRKGISPPQAA